MKNKNKWLHPIFYYRCWKRKQRIQAIRIQRLIYEGILNLWSIRKVEIPLMKLKLNNEE